MFQCQTNVSKPPLQKLEILRVKENVKLSKISEYYFTGLKFAFGKRINIINIRLNGKKFWGKVDRLFGAMRRLQRGQFPSVQTEANGSSNLININGLSSTRRGITKSPLRMFLSVYLLATDWATCQREPLGRSSCVELYDCTEKNLIVSAQCVFTPVSRACFMRLYCPIFHGIFNVRFHKNRRNGGKLQRLTDYKAACWRTSGWINSKTVNSKKIRCERSINTKMQKSLDRLSIVFSMIFL